MAKERLFSVFNGEKPDKIPWIPFAGVHAGRLRNIPAMELLTDEEKLYECLKEVNFQYHPDGQPIMFDLQIEAEVLGCELKWLDKSPPVVVSHPLIDTDEIPSKIPQRDEGRLPMYLNVMKKLSNTIGKETALFSLVTGPLTLASHLRGTKLYMDLLRNKDFAKNLIDYCKNVAIAIAEYYIEAGMDVIAVVDPVVSQISPRSFNAFLLEPFTEIFEFIKGKGKYSAFFVCGDATKNIEPMCQTKPDSIFIDENINMVEAKKITDSHNIAIGGNIPLTSVMLHGTQKDNMKYIIDLLDSLEKEGVGFKNLIIAPGCDMPYDVPPDNVIGVIQALQDTENVKKVLENYESTSFDIDIELPDYDNLKKPFIEVFTIDSDVCAACGYMKDMAFSAKDKYGDQIDIVEYKWTVKENIVRAIKMGLEHLPCMLINGQLKYSSIIPDQEEYFAEIDKLLKF